MVRSCFGDPVGRCLVDRGSRLGVAGVLMWEVFTCGKMPYSRMKNAEVVERVQRGHVLERPKYCAKDVYEEMRSCWQYKAEERPAFWQIREVLLTIYQSVVAD
ncbi:Tyrosine-protein kinase Btk29A [Amphibalanus amphitrite]|uniref:Tyrosine-protein kinase Btk29A n=1 Tax=Amphibalanus amphitrite TaxID=1232801 RepID=A0A6A4W185_AMPAM|nr:Tyrosine-protein kinase Btk29A [Amphibalanus amphitrite]